jgi:Fur family ferric uptake transcriptional regulator
MANPDKKLLLFEDFLKSQQLRRSRQRDIIARQFFESDKHLSVEELLQRSRVHDQNIGFATVYRTLKLLVESDLAHVRDFNTGRKLYEHSEEGENHAHMVCLKCGKVQEFASDEIQALQLKIAAQNNFVATSYRHELYGHCLDFEKSGKCKNLKHGSKQ